jgi:1-deoxy-D-xylulose-5-phosphate synthase
VGLLDGIRSPRDLRALTGSELAALAAEIRKYLVRSVARTGGHLGPNLGVVELTLAVHRVFDSPADRILWDTGHQSYVHKLVTGRKAGFDRLRKRGGLSGYPCRAESVHDLIENSHASTALSYADGLAHGFTVRGETERYVVPVVGDGALSGGMAWEALNNIGAAGHRSMVIVLNDNGRSYSPTVGGMARHLAELRAGPPRARGVVEHLGIAYQGPVDGHDLAAVEAALAAAKQAGGPVLVHCVTSKGRGYPPAENDEVDQFHAVGVIDPDTGLPNRAGGRSWTSVFAEEMVELGARRPDVVGVTAAMPHPVGLAEFSAAYPGRVVDVGIAEQHAVTAATGMAMTGLHPVVAIYATFLNRAFDQVLLDAALHNAGITFVLDRAGLTGSDGPSHNGMWDLSTLQVVPNLRLAAPRDGASLREQLAEAVRVGDRPTVLRFPKGDVAEDLPARRRIGGVDVLFETGERDVLLVAVGAMAHPCVCAARRLAELGIGVTVVDPRWVKPVPEVLVDLARQHGQTVTAEDSGKVGGVGAALTQTLQEAGVSVPVRVLGVPRCFPEHASRSELLTEFGLTEDGITEHVLRLRADSGRHTDLELGLLGRS